MKRSSEGYYYNENRKIRRERPIGGRRRVVWSIVDILLALVSIAAAVALVAGLLSRVISPEKISVLALAGLFFPIIFLVNLFCVLWWVVRWKRWFWFSLVVVLLGAGSIGLYYRSDLLTKPETIDRSRDDVVVASYNVMNFSDEDSPEGVVNFERVAEWTNNQNVQLLCLQEAYFSGDQSFDAFKGKLKKLSYGHFINATPDSDTPSPGSGYAVLSAWPVVARGVVCADSMNVYSVWADVKVGRDTLRVFNNHLQSTGISEEERATTLRPSIARDTLASVKLVAVAEKLMESYRQRAWQSRCVAEAIEKSPYPVVVCGDFNDTPMSYTYRKISSCGLSDAYVEKGKGVEHTFKGLYNLFRIDYVMSDEETFYVKEYDSHDEPMSDHKALVVRLGRNRAED